MAFLFLAAIQRQLKAGPGVGSISVTDEYDWPEPRREPVTAARNLGVTIDGTYVRADAMMGLGEHHVVACWIEREGRLGGCFAWVAQHRCAMPKLS